jgi:hypothetical protein
MAGAEKSLFVSTSRGTTVIVAPHFVQQYRRTSISRSVGATLSANVTETAPEVQFTV